MMRLILCAVLYHALVMVDSGNIGPGTWRVKYVTKCTEATHKFVFNINQNKINRTHDGFNADLLLEEDLGDKYSVRLDVCKHVDGGCKQFQVITDNSIINFVYKFAGETNVNALLSLAAIDPPKFPIKAGEYKVEGYIFDYSELPGEAEYGDYNAKCFMCEGNLEVGCIEADVEFKEAEDDDD